MTNNYWITDETEMNEVFRDFEDKKYSHLLLHRNTENEEGNYYNLTNNYEYVRDNIEDFDGVYPFGNLNYEDFKKCLTKEDLLEEGRYNEVFIEKYGSRFDYFTYDDIDSNNYNFYGDLVEEEDLDKDMDYRNYGVYFLTIPNFEYDEE